MAISREQFQHILFNGTNNNTRFTQDSPIYPDVWLEYYDNRRQLATYRADLILMPHRASNAAELFLTLQSKLKGVGFKNTGWEMASNGETVAVCLTFEELLTVALPLTNWWQKYLWENEQPTIDQYWLKDVVGAYYSRAQLRFNVDTDSKMLAASLRRTFDSRFPDLIKVATEKRPIVLWSVSRNRKATMSIEKSVPATKADAARRVFDIDGSEIAWAVLDTGIDARHYAFRKKDGNTKKDYSEPFGDVADPQSNKTRIVATYDFSNFRTILSSINTRTTNSSKAKLKRTLADTSDKTDKKLDEMEVEEYVIEIERDLKNGRMLDWSVLGSLLRIPHNSKEYRPPEQSHGTHVAGIIGAGWKGDTVVKALIGMCPGIALYDIRVLDGKGEGSEFNILAAIQFVRWMNSQKDGFMIHGVNLSLSMKHEVASYACGQTPVCDAAERLVSEGTLVVAAAGNQGQAMFQDTNGIASQGFRIVNITDPGNAENVITVGATHRDRAHTYGVSYFSSKGPTGDGRVKPDIVAPGEKIISTFTDNRTDRLDGTSMAAPHVSGAAALLLAKYRELIGRPRKVKQILCETATDLGREKYFQGAGMLDVLRALQSV